MELLLEKFRCFGDTQTARIAPITILVGENSTGKSSFLAGLRYILDFLSRDTDATFNKDPFYLGGFKDMAHYRGGKYGRDTSFKIGISQNFPRRSATKTNLELFSKSETNKRRNTDLNFSMIFTEVSGEAKPTQYKIALGDRSITIFQENSEIKALVCDNLEGFEHTLTSSRRSLFITSRNDMLTLEYFLRDLVFSGREKQSNSEKASPSAIDKSAAIVEEIWDKFRRLSARKTSNVFALAPVRTQPLRNYDPTQLSQSSEGDQLIARIGRLARVDPDGWKGVKANLENYGRITGLFESIKIQKLGRGESDPFRILVKNSGRESNIIDVGYGISQVLPFFMMISELKNGSTMLLQQPEVHLHPSAQAALGDVITNVASSRRSPSFVIETHSDFFIDRIRMAIRKGSISNKDVEILFFEKDRFNTSITSIKLDKEGEMVDPPDKYRSFFIHESLAVLGL